MPFEMIDDDIDSAADAIMANWTKNKLVPDEEGRVKPTKPAPRPAPAPVEDEDEDDHSDTSDAEVDDEAEEVEDETGEDPVEAREAGDEDDVKIKVGEETKTVKVKDLARLFGQEASLTQKSQAASAKLNEATAVAERHTTALTALKAEAEKAFEPYSKIDWNEVNLLVAAGQATFKDAQDLKAQADAAKAKVDYFGQELDGAVKTLNEERTKAHQEAGKQCLDRLNNKEDACHIEGFGQPVYDEMRTFAIKQGIPEAVISNVTDAPMLKILHMAMQFTKQQAGVAKTAKKKLVEAPKNVGGKTATNSTDRDGRSGKQRRAMDNLRKSGTTDDAMEALLSRWER